MQRWTHLTAGLLCNMRRDRNNDYADYDVLILNDMKYIIKVLGDMIKQGVHAHMFCSAPEFALWYSALALEETELRASAWKDSKNSDAESVEKQKRRCAAGF